MQLVTVLGGIMLLVSLVLGTIALVQKFSGRALGGFTTVILIQLFSSSIIMISLGIIGYYISKIYEEVKEDPGISSPIPAATKKINNAPRRKTSPAGSDFIVVKNKTL